MRTTIPVVLLTLLLLMPAAGIPAHAQITARLDWWRVYDGPGHGVDIPNAAVLDRAGNIHVAGRSAGSSMDNTVVSWSPTGTLLRVLRYDSRLGSWDEAVDIALDPTGRILLAGESSTTSSTWRTVTIQYDTNGSQRWLRFYPADSSFSANGVAVGPAADGSCYVASTPDFQVVKYSTDGTELWSARFRRETSQESRVRALAVAPGGEVFLVGDVSEECPEGICRYDLAVVKFDAAGNREWIRYYTRTQRSDEQAIAAALDPAGRLLVAVQAYDSTGEHTSVVTYGPDGALGWVAHHPWQYPRRLAVHADGSAVVAGYTWQGPEQFNYFSLKYGPTGSLMWARQVDHGSGNRDFLGGLCLDFHGNVYLTGGSRSSMIGNDSCVTVRFDPGGALVWQSVFGRPDGGTVSGSQVFADSAGAVRVMADGAALNGWDFMALGYSQVTVAVSPDGEFSAASEYALEQNYPNPFNPITTIRYGLPARSGVTLSVYTTLGQEVARLVQAEKEAGYHEVHFDASRFSSGLYFYRLCAGDYSEARRMLLLK